MYVSVDLVFLFLGIYDTYHLLSRVYYVDKEDAL